MISSDCDISDFIRATHGKNHQEIIEMADREATEAERSLYRTKATETQRKGCGRMYAQQLKNLIFFIRYGVKPAGTDALQFELYKTVFKTPKKPSLVSH